ncbi:hypothetical protein BGZ72_003195, partial [Mortierella alpina]
MVWRSFMEAWGIASKVQQESTESTISTLPRWGPCHVMDRAKTRRRDSTRSIGA